MSIRTFAEVFDANIGSDDILKETPEGLVLRTRNAIDVLSAKKAPLAEIQSRLQTILRDWNQADLNPLLEATDVNWLANPEREALLHELLCEAESYLEKVIATNR